MTNLKYHREPQRLWSTQNVKSLVKHITNEKQKKILNSHKTQLIDYDNLIKNG